MCNDKIHKVLLFGIPMSICNLRCHYCYLAQREDCYQGVQPKMKYPPSDFAKAFSKARMGGKCYMNFCADGETLLTHNIDQYIKALVEEGHYAEIVTNMTVTPMLDKIFSWTKELLQQVEFKCSFHYLELKRKHMLGLFASNVKKAWDAGASATIELTSDDELIPLLDEVKEFSMAHFGALPHISIARDDRSPLISYLTKLPISEYDKVWSAFDSGFWQFKKTIFGKKQTDFCYAGSWSAHVNMATGCATCCYGHMKLGDVIAYPELPFPKRPIGRCPIAHCYNGHALMSIGLIPKKYETRYGDIRDRVRTDGTHWLNDKLRRFFNTQLVESNKEMSDFEKLVTPIENWTYRQKNKFLRHFVHK